MKTPLRHLALATALLAGTWLQAAERIPAAPAHYFNDYANVVPASVAGELDAQLENYERKSSNQLLVVIFPTMESDSSVEDYTVRVAQAWRAGGQKTNNGAVLFAFIREHKLYIQVGYGLEATLTDAVASQIIQDELKPAFRAGDYAGGLRAAVQSMIAATQGEYKGSGHTRAEARDQGSPGMGILVTVFIIAVILLRIMSAINGPRLFANPRRFGSSWWIGSGTFGGGNRGGGGWSSGGGGGGFSGGGGSFGGGGAGGSW